MAAVYPLTRNDVADAVKRGEVTVALYGLGKMGLPLAAAIADAGVPVIGVDLEPSVVDTVNDGRSHVAGEPGLDEVVRRAVKAGLLRATLDGVEAARASQIQIILVPTLLTAANKPDLSAVQAVAKTISKGIRPGSLVIQESTVPPGTTDRLLAKWLATPKLKAGRDFGLAFCPERTSSGRALKDITEAYPKVVGGIDEASTAAAAGFYAQIGTRAVIPVRDARTAEAVKVFEGAYRDVNIALANELAVFCERVGIDAAEAFGVANTQPYSHIHQPGCGVGGHCIPVYPHFLMGEGAMPLLSTARRVNRSMPAHTIDLLKEALPRGRPLKGARVLVLGIAYRGGVPEIRYSPAVDIIRRLEKLGAKVSAHDPVYPASKLKPKVASGDPMTPGWDAIIVATDHREYADLDWSFIVRQMRTPVVVDGRSCVDGAEVLEAGGTYRRLGTGVSSSD